MVDELSGGVRAEPWLRGTLTDVPPMQRAVLHALELAREDVHRWCRGLSNVELNARPGGVASVAFHLRHIARSVDRLLTYAEGGALSERQLALLHSELEADTAAGALFAEFDAAMELASARIRAIDVARLYEARTVGRKALPTTVAGLLIHVAEHTQRHVGQSITTAKFVVAGRNSHSSR